MTDFPYIECPPGQEQGPAVEDVEPYCVPADPAMPGGPEPTFTLPVEPPGPVESFPPAVPLEPLPELAPTGLSFDQGLSLLALAVMLIFVGWFAWKASRRY